MARRISAPALTWFHAFPQDMNKIMMAVLQALQDERDRNEEKAAEQGVHPT